MQFFVDIQRKIFTDHGTADDFQIDDLSLLISHDLAKAIEVYTIIYSHNILDKSIEYIRLRLKHDGTELVLSRKTPSGKGDW
jgi:hypothetical protein